MNKKLIILGIVLIGVVLISGCIGEKNGEEEKIGEEKKGSAEEKGDAENQEADYSEEDKDNGAGETSVKIETKNWCTDEDPDAKLEEQKVNNKVMEMCCVHHSGGTLRDSASVMICFSKDHKTKLHDSTTIRNDGSGVSRQKEETWEEDGKTCKRITDENGEVVSETCK